ncbi:hypothetical protein [Paenibacillus naphthalenovorans]|uniref:hypothetical protein n=1 Tax=Paenibacillus naphthalenovorans TaxID=162209 RepID=UPI003D2D6DEC
MLETWPGLLVMAAIFFYTIKMKPLSLYTTHLQQQVMGYVDNPGISGKAKLINM